MSTASLFEPRHELTSQDSKERGFRTQVQSTAELPMHYLPEFDDGCRSLPKQSRNTNNKEISQKSAEYFSTKFKDLQNMVRPCGTSKSGRGG